MSLDELSVILTYACNFSCSYCPVHKSSQTVTREVLSRVLLFCLNHGVGRVRFFGAEPLLRWEEIVWFRGELDRAGEVGRAVELELTTNGSLVTEDILQAWESDERYQVRVSLDGDPQAQSENRSEMPEPLTRFRRRITRRLPLIHCNMVISPSTVDRLVPNFHYLYRAGFRFFNFLPVYYHVWSDAETALLEQRFDQLAAYCRSIRSVGFPLHIQNERVHTRQALMRDTLVVDTDGEVYESDAVVCSALLPYRDRLRLGSLLDSSFSPQNLPSPSLSLDEALILAFGDAAMRSTHTVDTLLSAFVRKLTVG